MGGSPDSYQVVFMKDNVSVHPTQYASGRISGRLRLIKQGASLFMVRLSSFVRSDFLLGLGALFVYYSATAILGSP